MVTEVSRRNPNCRKCPASLKMVHPTSVKTVGFVHRRHHHLRPSGVNEFGDHPCFLDLADDPIPIAYRFYRDRRPGFTLAEQLTDRAGMMFYTCLKPYLSVRVLNRCKAVPLVGIQCDIFHSLRLLIIESAYRLIIHDETAKRSAFISSLKMTDLGH